MEIELVVVTGKNTASQKLTTDNLDFKNEEIKGLKPSVNFVKEIAGIRAYLDMRNWTQGRDLFQKMINKADEDQEYRPQFESYMRYEGKTLMLRELAEPFGNYLKCLDFTNAVNSLDTAHFYFFAHETGEKLRISVGHSREICNMNAYMTEQGWRDGGRLLSQMIDNGDSEPEYYAAFVRYFEDDCPTHMLRELAKPLGDYWDDLSFSNAVDAIDAASIHR